MSTKTQSKDNATLNGSHPNANDSHSKIDAIKQLIFGDNIEAYNSEFESLKADILNKRKELEELIDSVKTELSKSLDDVATDLNIRITELEDKIDDKLDDVSDSKVNRKDLGDLLIKLGEKISQ